MDLEGLKKLYFIHHSTYLFRGEECWMLFDYYTKAPKIIEYLKQNSDIPLYIFSTHSHGDHYNPDVFSVFTRHQGGVHFIFHEELRDKVPTSYADKVLFLDTGETSSTQHFRVKAYGSTDLGGSFLITLKEHYTLFHAGDLNNWHWNQEASTEYIRLYETQWVQELTRIVTDAPQIELLMFPTDLRLGPDYLKGLKQFIAKIPTKALAPMHLNGSPKNTSEFYQLGVHILPESLEQ